MERTYPYFDPEFESLIERIHPPRVCIDNDTCEGCTLVKVDSANKHGILLEMVQVLTDLDLLISKSYISSDGGWFMDVFHVTDQLGNKITDERLIHYIEQVLCARRGSGGAGEVKTCLGRIVSAESAPTDHGTALELTGPGRLGLLSEISAVLADLSCNVSSMQFWTHNGRMACIVHVADGDTGAPIEDDPERLACVREQLASVLGGTCTCGDRQGGLSRVERRLHQMMVAERDFEGGGEREVGRNRASVSVERCGEKGYSVVSVQSRDRPKLLLDTVCALTDMQYVVFHAAISSSGSQAVQEYYIRRTDGCPLDSEAEKQGVMKCIEAAIERRVSHGLRLDIRTVNRPGLLSAITRVLRENGLSVVRADVATRGGRALNSFYVCRADEAAIDAKTLDAIRQEIGPQAVLEVRRVPDSARPATATAKAPPEEKHAAKFSLGSLFWSHIERLSGNFGSIRS
ncbi:ACT domain-containing protein ACR3 isoform X1 [Amborella trichopoda]|uniref:ACT domain-containing protein ACR3 isoform X1 n=1 Tax=Amborella trichopoda TaxID=13333 RepID=UPI0005D34A97|nr:ACT domain-containing protein ACR3 isoform X1 [Amborella trichopoda]XP_020530885.1 ACT domain-containing protein ACR3 isoform X1 [Amborella trichopoda]XP_020530886.1 ACT domain-containing protein ACR3 isoform X1 [Amborella trichopoda]XP_020530887.1 ACT domain-containing protein ACR3 isoform X1 [Amborella trichopoda]|eukprot:XP_011628028.1 ACT domain-containing protein ACR3 isoform X1 [Amborella trichopoda]